MNISHPHRTVVRRGQILSGALLLAAIGAAAVISGPAAMAAPSSVAALVAGKPKHNPQPSSASSITWSVIPASATAPDHRSTFNYANVKPGSTISDHVAVINRSSQSVAFTIYATDATGTTQSDALILLPAGKQPTQIGAWAKFSRNIAQLSVIIPGDKGVIEPFTINVPRNASPGDHVGAMLGQVTVVRKTRSGTSFNESQRIAVPILLRVIGPLHAGLRVESVSVGYHGGFNPLNDGQATVTFTVQNTGNVLLGGSQGVSVSGLFGAATARQKSLPVVLPGDAVKFTETTGFLYGAGPLTAHVNLSPGAGPGEPPLAAPMAAVTASASTLAVPWSILLILIVIGGGIVSWVRWVRYRQRQLQVAVNALADSVRRETEQRLLGGSGSTTPPGQA
ncbi:MAG TPA: hypothetical protein VK802_26990 [Streptosporangiaceae bacterium]|jgi:hypothetical protein|nr:hypothetical protein [Streptosporangiaceae bacterium]